MVYLHQEKRIKLLTGAQSPAILGPDARKMPLAPAEAGLFAKHVYGWITDSLAGQYFPPRLPMRALQKHAALEYDALEYGTLECAALKGRPLPEKTIRPTGTRVGA